MLGVVFVTLLTTTGLALGGLGIIRDWRLQKKSMSLSAKEPRLHFLRRS